MRVKHIYIATVAIFVMLVGVTLPHASADSTKTDTGCGVMSECFSKQIVEGVEGLKEIQTADYVYVPPIVARAKVGNGNVTYIVQTRGAITASLAEFKVQANETLNSSLGWARLGISFSEVASGGDFTLVLSEASQVPSFSPTVCGSDYSCNVGRYVIINQDRWLGATPAWNNGGGSLRDYRHMVINHETGHWLGHGHAFCSAAGSKAPVMQQQSINLQGCKFNPWPLESELWSTRLGL